MSDAAYLRFPHLAGDLLCFAAEDDIWVAPLGTPEKAPGRAWRVTADRTRVGPPRFSPDGTVIAFTNWRSLDPEVYLVPVDGGAPPRRLTYWGSADTRVCSWAPDGHALAVSSHGQPFAHHTWAHSVPREGGPGGDRPHPLTGKTVRLTTAHLDHVPENVDPANLRAYCERCHLAYDADEHRAQASHTRAIRAAGDAPPLFEVGDG